jgi:hypothetical protein
MKTKTLKTSLIVLFMIVSSFRPAPDPESGSVYKVVKLKKPMKIDAVWEKKQWKNVSELEITNYMGNIPVFRPVTRAKMMYDKENIYVIFQVQDCYVRCLTNQINGPVWQDSAVEFFFAPDISSPEKYFNLETNCGGTPLLHYNLIPRRDSKRLDVEDIKQIEIVSSLPQLIDPEISNPLTWTIEYKIPLSMLEKYGSVNRPAKGVEWRANFYKIAENSSNPHYITWSVVENDKPNFHMPKFFGRLVFE